MCDLEEIVVRAQAGDEEAYNTIHARFKDMALSYAFSIVGDHDLAEDVSQQAFLSAYCDMMALRNPSSFPSWFKCILKRHAYRIKKESRKIVWIPLENVPEAASEARTPLEAAVEEEHSAQLLSALEELPVDERSVAHLFYIDDLTALQIGETLGIPTRTVRWRLEKTRTRWRRRLIIMAKNTIQKQRLSGDLRLNIAATHEAVGMFDAEIESILSISPEERDEHLCDLICAKARLLRSMGEIEATLEALRQGLETPSLWRRSSCRARLRAEMGITQVYVGDYSAARDTLEKARVVLRRMKSPSSLLPLLLNGLGACAWGSGNFRTARRYFQEALEKSQHFENEVMQTDTKNNLALLDWKDGALEQALSGMQECLKVWEKVGGHGEQVIALMHIAIMEENMGRFKLAARHYGQSLALAQEVNDVRATAFIYGNLGNLELNLQHWGEALSHSAKALELAGKTKDRRSEAIALENMALANVGLGDTDAVWPLVRRARRIAKALDDRERLFSLDLVEVEARLQEGRTDGLIENIAKAEDELHSASFLSEYPRLLRLRAQVEYASGALTAARKTCRKARRVCKKQKAGGEEQRVLLLQDRMAEDKKRSRL